MQVYRYTQKNATNKLTIYKSSSSLVKFMYIIAIRTLNNSYTTVLVCGIACKIIR